MVNTSFTLLNVYNCRRDLFDSDINSCSVDPTNNLYVLFLNKNVPVGISIKVTAVLIKS